jgi:hypothetical protein
MACALIKDLHSTPCPLMRLREKSLAVRGFMFFSESLFTTPLMSRLSSSHVRFCVISESAGEEVEDEAVDASRLRFQGGM